jgi:hypothetical protein
MPNWNAARSKVFQAERWFYKAKYKLFKAIKGPIRKI